MAHGGGGAPAPRPPPACPGEWKDFFGCLVTLMRQTEAHGAALAAELARVQAQLELLRHLHNQRLAIVEDATQEIRRGAALKEEAVALLERKEPEEAGDPGFDELEENYLECLRSLSTLVDDNTKLKNKLEEVQSHAKLAENNVDHQDSAKDLKAQLRKLKQAYKTLVSEKDKEICAIRAERCFVWNQYKALEKDFKDTCNSNNMLIKQAQTAVKELEKSVSELRLKAEEKDVQIGRLQEEAARAKDEMLVMKNELEQMRLLSNKNAETDQAKTSQMKKTGMKVTNGKSELEGPVSGDKSRIPNATPVRTEEKTSRKHVSCAKGTHGQSGKNSPMHSTEGRGKSETSQKRKRGSSTSSHGLRRCSSSLQVRPVAASPSLFSPRFNIPKLTSPTPTKL